VKSERIELYFQPEKGEIVSFYPNAVSPTLLPESGRVAVTIRVEKTCFYFFYVCLKNAEDGEIVAYFCETAARVGTRGEEIADSCTNPRFSEFPEENRE